MTLEEEKGLVAWAKKDPEAFGRLYDHYAGRIFNYVFRRTVDFELSNDITSEVFLKAYCSLWKFQWRDIPLAAWLYRIANNEVNMFFRNKRYAPTSLDELRQNTGFDIPLQQDFLNEKMEAEHQLQLHQEFVEIQAVLRTLELKYQEVIALRYFEHKTNKEISEILGKKEGTVKSLISRGLEMIRKALTDKVDAPPTPSTQ